MWFENESHHRELANAIIPLTKVGNDYRRFLKDLSTELMRIISVTTALQDVTLQESRHADGPGDPSYTSRDALASSLYLSVTLALIACYN